uniref:Uncharacterized protein n=1 Tax=Anopheles albimanus TaxID=7167 RepID=A0A182FYE2_ANOAL
MTASAPLKREDFFRHYRRNPSAGDVSRKYPGHTSHIRQPSNSGFFFRVAPSTRTVDWHSLSIRVPPFFHFAILTLTLHYPYFTCCLVRG